MRKSTALILGELQGILSGYVALMNYKFLNLCVKAEAASLLPVTVEYDGDRYDIEQVADVTSPREDQLQVYPKEPVLLFAIGKAIALSHPEFKQEIVKDDSNGAQPSTINETPNDEDADKSILLTMPVVNKDRHDVLIDAIGVLYDETRAKLKEKLGIFSERTMANLAGAAAKETDEAKNALEDIRKQHEDLAQQYYDNKKKEIEDAYERYLKELTEKKSAQHEQAVATNMEAGQSFEMPKAPDMPE